MYPEIILANGWRIPAWGLFINLSWLAALFVAGREAQWRDMDRSVLFHQLAWSVLGGFLFAHIYYLAVYADKASLASWRELGGIFRGTAVQGAFIGCMLGSAFFLRWEGRPLLPALDVYAPAASTAQAVGRLGCFAAGCCYGKPTALPWGVVFSRSYSGAPAGIPLHPTQLYEAALGVFLAVFLHVRLRDRGRPRGSIWWEYLLGYGVIRFLVQFFRADEAGGPPWGLAPSQYAALAMALSGATLLWYAEPLARLER